MNSDDTHPATDSKCHFGGIFRIHLSNALKVGVRSLNALNFLRQQGFKYLKSVKGGITA